MKIYTRTGDAGETSLFDGTRVSKADAARRRVRRGRRAERLARAGTRLRPRRRSRRRSSIRLQRDLFALGAQLADPGEKLAARVTKAVLGDDDVARLEQADRSVRGRAAAAAPLHPGRRRPAGAALHVARTVCRRAERRMVALEPAVDAVLLRYINRLSDLLFVLARAVNHRAGAAETEW